MNAPIDSDDGLTYWASPYQFPPPYDKAGAVMISPTPLAGWIPIVTVKPHRALSREESARIDATIGLEELPPIRVSIPVFRALGQQATQKGLVIQAHVRELLNKATEVQHPSAPASKLALVRTALRDYHHALDMRLHAGVAQGTLATSIEIALGTPWVQGATLERAT